MFYNSKSLVDEKVLQQYYFEKLMLADSNYMKKLIPSKYISLYPNSKKVKVLQPEVKLAQGHIPDFVLYPLDSSSSKKLNIEIKWKEEDFLKQTKRFPYYNGEKEDGFLVCFHKQYPHGGDSVTECGISVVYLNIEDFKKWFSIHSNSIISQTLSKHLKLEPSRITGKKYWVVSLTSSSIGHYVDFGRLHNIWAFKDSKRSKNIMRILHGDYIIFAKFKSNPGRAIYEFYNTNKKIETYRNGIIWSYDINWGITLTDVCLIDSGYHLDFSLKPRYSGFEHNWDGAAGNKHYTQFITMYTYDNKDEYQFRWRDKSHEMIERKLFPADNEALVELVCAFRKSLSSGGDAVEISFSAFQNYQQILTNF